MTMRTGWDKRSPCELLRKINDLCQEVNDKDNEIRKLCAECEKKVKLLARQVPHQKRNEWKWEDNPGWEKEVELRLRDDYLQEGSKGEIGKVKE
jgi:hypothetical protein